MALKVVRTEAVLSAMDDRIDTRLDQSWQDLDRKKATAAADRAELRAELAYLRGATDEINRQRHGAT